MQVTLRVTAGPHEGQQFVFDEHDSFIVGRAKKAQFRLPQKDMYFSRMHFLVEVNPPLCRLVDLESRNGTYVNRKKVSTVELKDGDLIKGGSTVMHVAITGVENAVEASPSPPSERPPIDTPADRPPERILGDATIVPRNWPKQAGESLASPAVIPPKHSDAAPRPTPGSGTDTRSNSKSNPNKRSSDDWPSEFAAVVQAMRPGSCKTVAATPDPMPEIVNPAAKIKATKSAVAFTPANSSNSQDYQRLLPPNFRDLIRQCEQPIDGYQIVDELGRGGMGVVYRAICLADQAVVAIKTVLPAVRGTENDYAKFVREANILKSLDHPHIVNTQPPHRSITC